MTAQRASIPIFSKKIAWISAGKTGLPSPPRGTQGRNMDKVAGAAPFPVQKTGCSRKQKSGNRSPKLPLHLFNYFRP
jgi:hypothetical protein